jgi:hypothetical protein
MKVGHLRDSRWFVPYKKMVQNGFIEDDHMIRALPENRHGDRGEASKILARGSQRQHYARRRSTDSTTPKGSRSSVASAASN